MSADPNADLPNTRSESVRTHSSRLAFWVAVATTGLIAFELYSWLIHNRTEVWVIHIITVLFEACLATIVCFVLLNRERPVVCARLGKMNNQLLTGEQIRLQAAALHAAANGIVITDAKGTILWVNRAFSDLTGYSPEESVGQNPRMLKSWDYDHSFYRNLWSTIQAGKVWHGEIRNRKKDGSLYTEDMTITPLRSPTGEITHFIAIKQDITENKKLEAQYRHAQKMEAVGRLAGGVAHDFNNILTVITGYCEISLERLHPEDPVTKHLLSIKRAATRAASLTKQLLAFSRQQIVFPKPIDVNTVVGNVTDMLRRLVGDDVSIVLKPMTSLGAIKADVGQIEQVLMNLVVNARDAMPDGGEIIIETGSVDLDETYQRKHEPVVPGRYVMLSVSDSGCGMDETTKAHIFEPFFTTKAQGKGTGLGLSTVYGIVKQSGGYIWVYSEPGRGTTFKLFFPRIAEIAEKPVHSVQALGPWTGSGTILLVEDDDSLRELLVATLQNAGYRILEANTAEAAIELITAHKGEVQLLLTDVVMPRTSGVQLFESLHQSLPKLKAIFMSGYASEMLSRRDPLPHNSLFIEKPFSKESLLSTIHGALR